METLTTADVRAMRLRAQGLAGPRARDAAGATRRAAALQAQDAKACRLQLRVRSAGLTAAAMDAACAAGPDGPAVVRTWLMRGTLHAVPAQDARWMTGLLGQRVADSQRGRRQQLGLDDETCARALPALEKALAGQPPMLRDELVARLGEFGIALDPRSQAPAHLLLYAAGSGLVCRGPEAAGDKATYVLREEWLRGVDGPDLAGDEALAELAARHAAAYGPVGEGDFARWSGLPLGQARRGIRAAAGDGRLTPVLGPGGEPLWVRAGSAPPDGPLPVRLTGHFDPYLLGYRDRDLLLAPSFATRIATGGGLLMPCVLVDGAVAAAWRHEWRGAGRLEVRVEPLGGALPAAARAGVDEEVADLARFLGVDATWRLVDHG
ncbi:MAG: hypothetical protein QOF84_127 [Streptomyces sp.]|nr:hypothetical protein [Streptomyces sp.]